MVYSKLDSKLRKAYIRRHTANTFIDETGNQGYTIVWKKGFYKVPAANIFCWFPEIYDNNETTGIFQRFEKSNGEFLAIYKTISAKTYFIVNKELKVITF